MIYKRKFDRKTFEKYNKVLKNQESERFDESFGTETRKGHWNGSLLLEMAIELGKNHSTTVDFRLSCLMSSTRESRRMYLSRDSLCPRKYYSQLSFNAASLTMMRCL